MKKHIGGLALSLTILISGIYLNNASWLAAPPARPSISLVAHRGVHQNFDLAGVTDDTCTANRIRKPIRPEIENTLASMRAAFNAGAVVVEIDVHPTTDGQFAVFHDWTLECRTNGRGVTRLHSMKYLKTLDVGYGYTPDAGKTYPLRGRGIGLMPALSDVFRAFPQGRFLINFKSNDAAEGDMLEALLRTHRQWRPEVWGVYGGSPPTERALARISGLKGYTRHSVKLCLYWYAALGWSGYVPKACRNTILPIPVNIAPWLWGWPNRFEARTAAVGTAILLLGPYRVGDTGSSGVDDRTQVGLVPNGFNGFISTNEIGVIAPLLARR